MNIITEKAPFYEKLFQGRRTRWVTPEKGMLAGQVVNKTSTINFQIIDLHSKTWYVQTEERKLHPMVIIEVGKPIKMIGRPVGTSTFQATLIMPSRPHVEDWFKHHKMMHPGARKPSPEVRGVMEEKIKRMESIMK